jgi:Flp pilus assembly protein TadD
MYRSTCLVLVLGLVLSIQAAAQRTGGGGGGSTGTGARTGPTGTANLPQPNSFPTQTDRQVLYITGAVFLQNGGPPPEPVAIERVCGGSSHKEGYTDSKGHYQIQLGQNFELQDVSESTSPTTGFGTGSQSSMSSSSPLGSGVNTRDLIGCELRAMLPGFQSSSVMIRPEGSFGEIRVDTIVLQQLGGGTGSTVSLTTMQAPSRARHAYEKAQKAIDKENLKDAEKELSKAVLEYPKFAAAWALLGMIHQNDKQLDQATKDYNQAIASDPQYARPYFGLAAIAAGQQNWAETVRLTEQLNRLAPLAYPDAYFFSGIASYNLKKLDDAERSMRKFLALDTEHRKPIAVLYLGEILSAKKDFAGAVEQTRAYLALAPNAPNSDSVRARLKEFEQLSSNAPQRQ